MRKLHEIAAEIQKEWENPYFGAVLYLDAMHELESIDDYFYQDSGRIIVTYFLANAQHFRGEAARRLKAELRRHLGR